jgi:hypothetical protein
MLSLRALVSLSIVVLAGCASGNSGDPSTTAASGGGEDGAGGADGGGGPGPGPGGTTTSSGGGASSSPTSSSGGEGGAGAGGGTGAGAAPAGGAHLLIAEIGAEPTTAEFVEIVNPSDEAVSLGDVYLSDNAAYHRVTSGVWDPTTTNPGTDWLVRFPPGSSIAAGGRIWIAGRAEVEATFGACPDFSWGEPIDCGAALMVEPVPGTRPDLAEGVGHLSDSREMIILFRWSGAASDLVEDLDYVTWGELTDDAGARVDKTGEPGYAPDTARAAQRSAPAADQETSISRCGDEVGEAANGGNGALGHDETSEDFGASFAVTSKTPGAPNACP